MMLPAYVQCEYPKGEDGTCAVTAKRVPGSALKLCPAHRPRLPFWPKDDAKQTDNDKGGGMLRLFNQTDQVYASPDEFRSRAAAEKCARDFRRRFAVQGYYLTASGRRIAPEDVDLVVESVEP